MRRSARGAFAVLGSWKGTAGQEGRRRTPLRGRQTLLGPGGLPVPKDEEGEGQNRLRREFIVNPAHFRHLHRLDQSRIRARQERAHEKSLEFPRLYGAALEFEGLEKCGIVVSAKVACLFRNFALAQ